MENKSVDGGCYLSGLDQTGGEEIVRKAAQQVNDILKEYREKWPNVEKERIMTMIAYRFSLESLLEKQRNDTTPYTEKITELTKTLEEHFKKE